MNVSYIFLQSSISSPAETEFSLILHHSSANIAGRKLMSLERDFIVKCVLHRQILLTTKSLERNVVVRLPECNKQIHFSYLLGLCYGLYIYFSGKKFCLLFLWQNLQEQKISSKIHVVASSHDRCMWLLALLNLLCETLILLIASHRYMITESI